jgi:hypothetical protein
MLLFPTAALSVAVFAGLGTAAQAHIVCHEGYQVVEGQEISTPYCNDNYVAAVARDRGAKVSDAQVRNNPAKKDEICRWIGGDTRLAGYCNSSGGRDRGR